MEEYKWVLVWRGMKDCPMMWVVEMNVLQQFALARDAQLHLVMNEEYMVMVERGDIAPPRPGWGVREGQVGAIALSTYERYKDWETISAMKDDFINGWMACLKASKK